MSENAVAPLKVAEKQTTVDANCLNCNALLYGKYCAQCGQSTEELHRPALSLAKEILEETLSLDGRFIHTLRLLYTKPGGVAGAWSQGRRRSFASPMRFYFAVTLFYFLALQVGSKGDIFHIDMPAAKEAHVEIMTGDDGVTPQWAKPAQAFFERAAKRVSERPDEFNQRFQEWMRHVIVFMVPVLALLLRAFYWAKDRYVIDDIVFSLYLHAGIFLMFTVSTLAVAINKGFDRWADAILFFAVIIYTIASARSYFRNGIALTIAKWIPISLLYFTLLGISTAVALVVALSQFG